MRRHYLITYDIADDKRRTAVFETLKDHGDHAQFSVFFCELNRRELAELRGIMQQAIHDHEDQILVLDLGPEHNPLDTQIECLGRPYDPTPRSLIV
ncbi:MAG: CRISPR-associated endonuclease Cas2 [Planctomycetota bacterium]